MLSDRSRHFQGLIEREIPLLSRRRLSFILTSPEPSSQGPNSSPVQLLVSMLSLQSEERSISEEECDAQSVPRRS